MTRRPAAHNGYSCCDRRDFLYASHRPTEHVPACRVLLISGNNAAAEMLERSEKAGFSFPLLAKPVHPHEILNFVKQSLA